MRALALIQSENAADVRLDSWKAIAQYLTRDVATARRWEKMGLPVRRVPGGRGSSVFAFTEEIDQWLAEGGTTTAPPPAAAPGATVKTWGRLSRLLAVAAPLVVALGWWARVSHATIGDVRIELTPEAVIAFDRANAEQWRHEFPGDRKTALSPVAHQPQMVLGNPPAVLAMTAYSILDQTEAAVGGQLLQLNLQGRLQRSFSFDDSYRFDGKTFAAPWAMTTFAVNDAAGARRIAVAAHHYVWDPGIVTILDDQFRRHGTFVHAGWIEAVRWLDPTRLVVGGYSNQEAGGMIALLDPDALDGQGPAEEGTRHYCDSCGRNRPLAMVVMPRSEVNIASGARFNRVVLDSMHSHIVARTMEVQTGPEEPADAIYEFDQTLQLVGATYSERYWTVHRQLELAGRISHGRERCPDRAGPRTIRVWTPANGWRTQAAR
ncbi:MAG TPA: hypothetical protein VFV98_15135 [Vicinamibacterales bacterium]|nr:hypothetical protein [Vicinamibacterales bacterium]